MQRAQLRKKGTNPDTLIMTATPIPRTSPSHFTGPRLLLIDELPPNRTRSSQSDSRASEKYRLRSDGPRDKSGRQVYVVYPLIEESKKQSEGCYYRHGGPSEKISLTSKSVSFTGSCLLPKGRYNEGFQKRLNSDARIHNSHRGRSRRPQRDADGDHSRGNASGFTTASAKRKSGRGAAKSHCLLLNYGGSVDAMKRLDIMARSNDGFKIAEKDLEIRGPGEFFGTRQSGLPDLKAANLLRDYKLLEIGKKAGL